jgi:hypothetical protein
MKNSVACRSCSLAATFEGLTTSKNLQLLHASRQKEVAMGTARRHPFCVRCLAPSITIENRNNGSFSDLAEVLVHFTVPFCNGAY